jgi:hypothetical protein
MEHHSLDDVKRDIDMLSCFLNLTNLDKALINTMINQAFDLGILEATKTHVTFERKINGWKE